MCLCFLLMSRLAACCAQLADFASKKYESPMLGLAGDISPTHGTGMQFQFH